MFDIGLSIASKVKQLKRLKDTQKLIKAELKHLPADAAYRFRKEMARINELPSKEKVKAIRKLNEDLKEFREIQNDILNKIDTPKEIKNCFIKR